MYKIGAQILPLVGSVEPPLGYNGVWQSPPCHDLSPGLRVVACIKCCKSTNISLGPLRYVSAYTIYYPCSSKPSSLIPLCLLLEALVISEIFHLDPFLFVPLPFPRIKAAFCKLEHTFGCGGSPGSPAWGSYFESDYVNGIDKVNFS